MNLFEALHPTLVLPIVGLDIGAISPESFRDNSAVLRFGAQQVMPGFRY